MRSSTLIIYVLLLVIIVVIICILIRRRNGSYQSHKGKQSSSTIPVSTINKISLPPFQANFNPDGINTPDLSIYKIVVDPAIQKYRDAIFHTHIQDIKINSLEPNDAQLKKILSALAGYQKKTGVKASPEQIMFLVKYKKFLDLPDVYSMCGPGEIDQAYLLMLNLTANNVPGALVETGIWKGGMLMYLKALNDYFQSKGGLSRRIWGLDAFDTVGTFPDPEPSLNLETGKMAVNAQDNLVHAITTMMYETMPTLGQVNVNFYSMGLLDDSVSLVKGLFKDTLPEIVNSIDQIALLRVDNDYYDSVYLVLDTFYAKISKDGFVIIDDYNNPVLGCKQAVTDFRMKYNISNPIIDTYGGSVYWQV